MTHTQDMNRIGYNFNEMRLTKNKWVDMNFMRLAMKTKNNKNNNNDSQVKHNKQTNKQKFGIHDTYLSEKNQPKPYEM